MINIITMNTKKFRASSHVIIFSALILTMCACACDAINAQPPETDHALDTRIDKLLRISGVMDQLKSFHDQVLKAFPVDAFPSGRLKRKAREISRRMAGQEALIPTAHEIFAKNLDHVLMNRTMEFYESKLGGKVGRLVANINEKHGRNLKALARKTEYRISQKRRKALERIVMAQQIGSRNYELTLSLLNGLLESDQSEQGYSQKALWQRLEEIENKVKAMQRRTNQLSVELLSLAFRSLEDEELERLARFQESDAGQWYASTLHKTCLKISHDMGKALAYAIAAPGPDEDENQ